MATGAILIVDDEPQVRSTLAEALEYGGYDIDCAESAHQALEKLALRHFPVILTDLNMPGGPSGLDLLSEVRSRDPNILVVIITGFATLDSAIGALKRGAYDFIQKPFKISEIEAVLDRALEHARVLAELGEYHRELEQRVLARTREFRAFHEEVLELNELTLGLAGETDPAVLLAPFLAYLERRWHPTGLSILDWNAGGWTHLVARGAGPWPDPATLPAPPHLSSVGEWEGCPHADGYRVSLGGEPPSGLLLVAFSTRSAFYPEDPSFALWRRQVGGLLRARHRALGRTR